MEVGYNSGGNLYFSMNVTPWFSSGVGFTGVNMRKSYRNLWIFIVLCGILSVAFICIYCFAPFDFIEMNEDMLQKILLGIILWATGLHILTKICRKNICTRAFGDI